MDRSRTDRPRRRVKIKVFEPVGSWYMLRAGFSNPYEKKKQKPRKNDQGVLDVTDVSRTEDRGRHVQIKIFEPVGSWYMLRAGFSNPTRKKDES